MQVNLLLLNMLLLVFQENFGSSITLIQIIYILKISHITLPVNLKIVLMFFNNCST